MFGFKSKSKEKIRIMKEIKVLQSMSEDFLYDMHDNEYFDNFKFTGFKNILANLDVLANKAEEINKENEPYVELIELNNEKMKGLVCEYNKFTDFIMKRLFYPNYKQCYYKKYAKVSDKRDAALESHIKDIIIAEIPKIKGISVKEAQFMIELFVEHKVSIEELVDIMTKRHLLVGEK
jgi:hypothetical protein